MKYAPWRVIMRAMGKTAKTKPRHEGNMVTVRISDSLRDRVEAYEKHLRSREDSATFSDALRRLLLDGLAAHDARQAGP